MSDFEKIRATVIQCFQNVGVFLDSSQQDISINEYDLDSIAYISFIVEIEKALQIEVPDTYLQYDNFTSLNGFVNILCELINAPLKGGEYNEKEVEKTGFQEDSGVLSGLSVEKIR